jgi:hypothetical protein
MVLPDDRTLSEGEDCGLEGKPSDGTTGKYVEGATAGEKCGLTLNDYGRAAGPSSKIPNAASGRTCVTLGATGAECPIGGDCLRSVCGSDKKWAAACSEL